MRLRFWGTRGSIAAPGPATVRFGGNTSCVEVETNAGSRLIFDCGTGARALGDHLMRGRGPVHATILFSHTHWDHVQGFPFFAPVFVPGSRITLCGPESAQGSLPSVLAAQMDYAYFPVELAQLGADLHYQILCEGTYEIAGTTISTRFLNHPAMTMGYRLESDAASLLYLCDHEPYWEPLWWSDGERGAMDAILHDGDRRHASFMQNADVVIHDAQYTPEEYASKRNWGHSTYSYITQLAAAANVKRLFLTHHDPAHDDAFLADVEQRSQQLASSLGSSLQVSCAYEGYETEIEGLSAPPNGDYTAVASSTSDGHGPILIIGDDGNARKPAVDALRRGGHEVLEATADQNILGLIEDRNPSAVLIELGARRTAGLWISELLRSSADKRPVIVMGEQPDENTIRSVFQLGAADFIIRPFTPPQLDARVRASFTRAKALRTGA